MDTDDRTSPSPPTSVVDLEPLLGSDDVRALLEAAEQSGSLRAAELAEIVEAHELDPLEQEALVRELEQARHRDRRGEPRGAPRPRRSDRRPESTTDALQLFLREAGRHRC